jgi:glycine/D-amino acid oxidase-like deaminating enzyme
MTPPEAPRPAAPARSPAPPVSRRRFLEAAAFAGAGLAWAAGAGWLLRDDRWTPNRSFWVARGRAPLSPPARGRLLADVAILGAGITGLSAAVHLLSAHPRLRVVLLEAHYAGYGATGRSGGVLGDGTERGDREGTGDNVALVLDLVDRFGIACDLERGPQTRLDPYRLAAGLKGAAESLGAAVHEESRVLRLLPGRPVVAAGEGFEVRADRVLLALNGYLPRIGHGGDRIVPVHTAAAVTPPLPEDVLRDLPDSLHVMTSREMYLWGRKVPGGRLLAGAGARYFYGDGLRHRGDGPLFAALRRALVRAFPVLGPYPFEHRWTGPMGTTSDQEPIVGSEADGAILFGGGYAGHGLAMGARMGGYLAGMLDGIAPPSWLMRDTLRFPPEPLRYIGVNAAIQLMNLGLYSMAKHE